MKVSFIIPVYNTSSKMLNRCIESIKQIISTEKEILLIDDGSNNQETLNKLSDYGCDREVEVIRKQNAGPSSARNLGLDQATGDFIMFVDSDDYITAVALDKIIKKIEEHTDIDICCFLNNVVNERMEIVREGLDSGKVIVVDKIDELNAQYSHFNLGVVWGKLFNRKVIDTIRFDEKLKYCEDALFLRQVGVQASKVIGVYQTGYNYVINTDSLCHRYNKNIVGELSESINRLEDFYLENERTKINDFYYTVIFDYYLNNILSQNFFNDSNIDKFYKRYLGAVRTLRTEPFKHVLKLYTPQINSTKFKMIYILLKSGFVYMPYTLFKHRFRKK